MFVAFLEALHHVCAPFTSFKPEAFMHDDLSCP